MFKKIAKWDYTLLLLLTIHFIFQLIVLKSGFPGASGDDFYRALIAYEWKETPFLLTSSLGQASAIWFPTHFWISGAMYLLTDNLIFSLTSISLFFSVVELVILFHLTRILFNRKTGLIALILVLCLPWQVWLGISMTEMTLYFSTVLGAFLAFLKWQKEHRYSFLLTSSFLFMLTTMLRPEGWLFAAVFSSYLAYLLARRRIDSTKPGYIIVAILIPSLFILFWFGYNYTEFGNPLYFVQVNKENVEYHLDHTSLKVYVKSLQYLFLMCIISPIIFILAGISLFRGAFSFVISPPLQRSYLYFTLSQLALITITSLLGPGTLAAPQRYAFINVLLLVPFAAFLLTQLWNKSHGHIIVAIIILVHLSISTTKSFYYPETFKDTINVGTYLKDSFEEGRISNSEHVCTELAFRRIIGKSLHIKKDFLTLSSMQAALEVYSDKPRNFLFNILKISEKDMLVDLSATKQDNETEIVPFSPDKIKSELDKMRVNKIILQDRKLMEMIPSNFHFERMIGTHAVFSITPHFQPQYLKEPYNNFHRIDKEYDNGIHLKAYQYEGSLLPHTLSLLWEIKKDFLLSQEYMIKIKFSSLHNPHLEFERNIRPIFNWYKMKDMSDSIYIKDNIPLILPPGMLAGTYLAELVLVKTDTVTFKHQNRRFQLDEKMIELSPVTLYSSKRDILKDFFKNPEHDWILLAKTLLLL